MLGRQNQEIPGCGDAAVFVVEDSEDYRALLATAFERTGISKGQVRMVSSGEEAIGTLTASAGSDAAPSLIVLDLRLRRKSGLDVLAWIKSVPALQGVPVFMLTASEDPSHIERAYRLGIDGYFLKPLDFHTLLSVVQALLRFSRSRSLSDSARSQLVAVR